MFFGMLLFTLYLCLFAAGFLVVRAAVHALSTQDLKSIWRRAIEECSAEHPEWFHEEPSWLSLQRPGMLECQVDSIRSFAFQKPRISLISHRYRPICLSLLPARAEEGLALSGWRRLLYSLGLGLTSMAGLWVFALFLVGLAGAFSRPLFQSGVLPPFLLQSLLYGSGLAFLILGFEGLQQARKRHLPLIPFHLTPVSTGDPSFDASFVLRGNQAEILASMDEVTRHRLKQLPRELIPCIHESRVSLLLSPKARNNPTPDLARAAVGQCAALMHRFLGIHRSIPEALSHNCQSDGLPAVRLRNLRVLLATYPNHPATQDALTSALLDEAPELQTLARAYLYGQQQQLHGQLSHPIQEEGVLSLTPRAEECGRLSYQSEA